MRGLPWLRLVGVVAIFAIMGWPVWRLTRPGRSATTTAVQTPTETGAASKEVSLGLQASFAGPAPASFQVKQAAQTILHDGDGKKSDFSAQWSTFLPKEGVDLTVQASWPPESAQSAVRISVSLPSGQQIEKLFWARESLVEIITVTEAALEPAAP